MAEEGLRRDVHRALDAIDRPAPHLPHVVAKAIRDQAQGRRGAHVRAWLVAAAVLALAALAALTLIHIGERTPSTVPAGKSTPSSERAPWSENLTFAGAISAEVHATQADNGEIVNDCAYGFTRVAGDFVVDLYLPAGDGSQVIRLELVAVRYHGPGTYTNMNNARALIFYDNSEIEGAYTWSNYSPEDRVTLTVDPGERSGAIDARLSPAGALDTRLSPASPSAPITVTGTWSCHASR